jgi:hypothetical protein
MGVRGEGASAEESNHRHHLPLLLPATASGQTAAAPPSSVMNARLFTRSPRRRGRAASVALQGQALSRS